jgi:uncharacterized protein (DUF1778 family)
MKEEDMAKDSPSPVSFRLSPDDRRLVETVAAYKGQSLSDFVRTVVLEAAKHVVSSDGEDKILKALEESSERMSEQRKALYQRGIGHVGSRQG